MRRRERRERREREALDVLFHFWRREIEERREERSGKISDRTTYSRTLQIRRGNSLCASSFSLALFLSLVTFIFTRSMINHQWPTGDTCNAGKRLSLFTVPSGSPIFLENLPARPGPRPITDPCLPSSTKIGYSSEEIMGEINFGSI